MTIREMHYDLKQKLNKLDSQKNRDMLIPEIDWKLNEAQEVFVNIIAEPRLKSQLGFEVNQRTIDDIRSIVVNQTPEQSNGTVPTKFDGFSYISELPDDYWHYLNGRCYASKGSCSDVKIELKESQHDDEVEDSPFNRSSFEWRESNIRFVDRGLRIFTDGSYEISKVCIDYIRKAAYMHNAQDFDGGSYNTLDGGTLSGSQNCELPSTVHRELVDMTVYLIAFDIVLPELSIKSNKVRLVQG